MPHQRRKIAFSGKKKKDQLFLKRQVKGSQKFLKTSYDDDDETTEDTEVCAKKLMEQPIQRGGATHTGRNRNTNRYNLQFHQETKKALEQIKLEAHKPFDQVLLTDREIDLCYFQNYDFPIRPKWHHEMGKDLLDHNENRYFREYVEKLQKTHMDKNKPLSLFELNLETWRQLWRVIELSDILLIIVDVRYATLMFPPFLYTHITQTLKKYAILVLNKVDLVTPEVVVAWKHYFTTSYPGLPVVLFASNATRDLKGSSRSRKWHNRSMEGVYNIYRECHKLAQSEVDLSSWEQKILEDMRDDLCFDDDQLASQSTAGQSSDNSSQFDFQNHEMFRDGILTIGCVGFPNVGKSSFINAMKGRKVVSVSRTPGHTKHFQTIFLTNKVRLCDCPGLVFPSSTPKYLQVLLGSYPISQLQAPYLSLKYLCEHVNLPELLKLKLPEDCDTWTAAAVCDAWAIKRGYLTAKAARPDGYRAANQLLRMCLAGQQKIILLFYPPEFVANRDYWLNHPDNEVVKKYQNSDDANTNRKRDDTPSQNSESDGSLSDNESSSNDETNAEEDQEKETPSSSTKSAFSLLESD